MKKEKSKLIKQVNKAIKVQKKLGKTLDKLQYVENKPKRTIIKGIATVEQPSNGVKIITVTKPDGLPVNVGEIVRVKW